jgi:tRNA (guanine-N7-)-methyltransferase
MYQLAMQWEMVPVFFDFHERIGRWPDAPKGRTRREIVAPKKGLRAFSGSGTAKVGLSEDDALKLAEGLPPPTSDAARRFGSWTASRNPAGRRARLTPRG